jgi:hypothetical protein
MDLVTIIKSGVFHTIDFIVWQPLKRWYTSSPLEAATLETLLEELNDYLSSKDTFLYGACGLPL